MRATVLAAAAAVAFVGGCATLPPGSDFPKKSSTELVQPQQTRLGRQFADGARAHDGKSAFRIISVGADGFAARVQMVDAAERSLDLQYFIFRGDATGRLLTYALLRAADRGVHLRVLVDDGDTLPGDEQILTLAAHPQVEVRVFNPFAYRGHVQALRAFEFMTSAARLDYRMHNKLLVADNATALIGGRNIGDEYFQVSPDRQFADDDVFVAGPTVQKLSATFDDYWNSALAIPVEALADGKPSDAALARLREMLSRQWEQARHHGVPYVQRAASGEPFAAIVEGRLPLVWSTAKVLADSPSKKKVEEGAENGRLIFEPVAQAIRAVRSELLLVTPYFVPTPQEMDLFAGLRRRRVVVRVLTNSLESTNELAAYAGYVRHRPELLRAGVRLYELRALPESAPGTGQSAAMSDHGNFGLHGKLFVFDRRRLFVGSMNLDPRSAHLNTEVGLIIDSAELAAQTEARFEAMTRPANSYQVSLLQDASGQPHLLWRTEEAGKPVVYRQEPVRRSDGRRVKLGVMSLIPLDGEL